MKKYFLHIDGKNMGPYSTDDLRNLKIERSTMIWFGGLDKWMKAEHVEELKSVFELIPPTFLAPPQIAVPKPREIPKPPPIILPKKETNNYQTDIGKQKEKKGYLYFIALLVVSSLTFLTWFLFSSNKNTTSGNPVSDKIAPKIETPQAKKNTKKAPIQLTDTEGGLILTSIGENVRIRNAPNLDADVLYKLYNGEKVLYLDKKTDFMTSVIVNNIEKTNYWFWIQCMEDAEIVGWVHGDFVEFPNEDEY